MTRGGEVTAVANFEQMVDLVLEHKGTPRRHLFEYPHRADDSRDMIASAEALVRNILRLAEDWNWFRKTCSLRCWTCDVVVYE